VGLLRPIQSKPVEEERGTTLSLEANGQWTGSVHLAEKLCSFYLLKPIKHYKASARAGGTACRGRTGLPRPTVFSEAGLPVRHGLLGGRDTSKGVLGGCGGLWE
jgi:hypothetical protein